MYNVINFDIPQPLARNLILLRVISIDLSDAHADLSLFWSHVKRYIFSWFNFMVDNLIAPDSSYSNEKYSYFSYFSKKAYVVGTH